MMATENRELVTYDEAARRFGINVNTLRTWGIRREIKRFRRGDGRILVDAREVAAVIERKQRIDPVE